MPSTEQERNSESYLTVGLSISWCVNCVVCGAGLSFASHMMHIPRCAVLFQPFGYGTQNSTLPPAVYVIYSLCASVSLSVKSDNNGTT